MIPFSEVVDYKKKTLLYSEEQIKKVLDETVALKTRSLALNWKIKDTGVVSLNDLEELGGEKTVHTVFAMPNQESGSLQMLHFMQELIRTQSNL